MRCIIIDDEPLALGIIRSYCEEIGGIEVAGMFTNPLDAMDLIQEPGIDLVFLDIEMPQISGIDFIESLENRPYFIFTTAYAEYATSGFDLNAVDYLVKPIPFLRFVKSINRVKELMELRVRQQHQKENLVSAGNILQSEDQFIFIKSEYENIKIGFDDITFIQGLKDYLKVHTTQGKPILTLMNFKTMEDKLPPHQFIRVHRSYLVNVNWIRAVQRSKILMGDIRIPIGESYRNEFLSRLGLS